MQKEEEKFAVVCSRPPQNVALRGFHFVVAQWTSKKYTNKCNTRAELLFCSKTNCFWTLSLSPSSNLVPRAFPSKKEGKALGTRLAFVVAALTLAMVPMVMVTITVTLKIRIMKYDLTFYLSEVLNIH